MLVLVSWSLARPLLHLHVRHRKKHGLVERLTLAYLLFRSDIQKVDRSRTSSYGVGGEFTVNVYPRTMSDGSHPRVLRHKREKRGTIVDGVASSLTTDGSRDTPQTAALARRLV